MASINVGFLFVLSYHEGKLGVGYMGFLCIISYDCTGIYNYLKVKSFKCHTKLNDQMNFR